MTAKPIDRALIVNRVSSLAEIEDAFRNRASQLRRSSDALPISFVIAHREALARAETWEAAANFLSQTHLSSGAGGAP